LQKIRQADIGDVVLIDIDAGSVTTQYNDLELLPDDVVSFSAVIVVLRTLSSLKIISRDAPIRHRLIIGRPIICA